MNTFESKNLLNLEDMIMKISMTHNTVEKK